MNDFLCTLLSLFIIYMNKFGDQDDRFDDSFFLSGAKITYHVLILRIDDTTAPFQNRVNSFRRGVRIGEHPLQNSWKTIHEYTLSKNWKHGPMFTPSNLIPFTHA